MILFITRSLPDPEAFGGAQRAWNILQTLREIGPVDLMVIYKEGEADNEAAELDPHRLGVRWCRKIKLRGWEEPLKRWPGLPHKLGKMLEFVTPYCTEAPRLPRSTISEVLEALPERRYDLVVAGRLPSAVLADYLGSRGVAFGTKLADLDDVLSDFSRHWLEEERPRIGRVRAWQWAIDANRIEAAERKVLAGWDAVSVCNDEDVGKLGSMSPVGNVFKVPNIVDRDPLPAANPATARILFVGSLFYWPNVQGLELFVDRAWPLIRERVPNASFEVVGMRPSDDLRRKLVENGVRLHADVPSVRPHYEAANVVICPVFLGGGTRIKVIETFAYGRPLVATELGAAGLGVENGVHALIADDMREFANAVVQACTDHQVAEGLTSRGRALYEQKFGPAALREALKDMVSRAEASH